MSSNYVLNTEPAKTPSATDLIGIYDQATKAFGQCPLSEVQSLFDGATGTLTFAEGGVINADSGTGTAEENAVVVNKMAGVVTTEALTTAAGSGQDITVTNTLCAAADILLITQTGGTSTGGTPIFKAVPGSGSFVVTIDNKHASAAFDGTFVFSFLLIKA